MSISVGIVSVLSVSEIARQRYEDSRLKDFERESPERIEAATRANLSPIAQSIQSALEDVMAEGNMRLVDKVLVRQQKVDGVRGVSLYGSHGKATHASRADLIGERLDRELLDRMKVSGHRADRIVGDTFEIFQPFIAKESCLQCHQGWSEGQVGGVLGLRVSNASLARVQSDMIGSMQSLRKGTIILDVCVSVALMVLLVLLVTALVRKQIIRPLATATAFIGGISDGDLTRAMDESLRRRTDEYGTLARAMEAMATRLRTMLRNIVAGVQTIGTASRALSEIAQQTAAGVGRVSAKTEAAALAAADASSYAMAIASAIESASTGLSSASNATQTMSGHVGEVVEHSERAKRTTEQATSKAASISASMVSLDEATRAIGQVTEAITGISAQTNLLALNATIEAARAGVQGKGFAVVAAEIKALAEQTAQATLDVKDKIASVQSSTATAIADLAGIATVIEDVGGTVSQTALAMTEHAEASQQVVTQLEQASSGVDEANRSVDAAANASLAIATDIVEVNDCVTEIRRAGEQVQHSAQELLGLADDLTTMVDQFKLPAA